MNLLLTSSGLTNQSIADTLCILVGKPAADIQIGFIPTAAYVEEDIGWLNEDIENIKAFGIEDIKMIDIAKREKEEWLPVLEGVDVVWLNGGNTYYLLDQVRKSGLQDELSRLLESRVYVGSSAGSIVAGPDLSINEFFPEEAAYKLEDITGLGYVPFTVLPHFKSPLFPEPTREQLDTFVSTYPHAVYAIDDETALSVQNGTVQIITEGEYEVFNEGFTSK